MIDPNSFDQELKDSQKDNPENSDKGTEGKDNLKNIPPKDAEPKVDYEKKFSESSKEALRLLEENKLKDQKIAEFEKKILEKGDLDPNGFKEKITEELYPGFNELDKEAQDNLLRFSDSIAKKSEARLLKDPAIAFARSQYNEKKWESAFIKISEKYPELKDKKDDFKTKYFKATNVPDNIENILEDISKIYLFDNAKDVGAREEKEKQDRIDLERSTGGDKTPRSSRSLGDWQKMAQENPAQFAKMSREYHNDLASGKLKE